MIDSLYKQKKNLFIKREKFERRLIKYLENLIRHMRVSGGSIPCGADFCFRSYDKEGELVLRVYSMWTNILFSDMKNATETDIKYYDEILDDFHRELDNYEKALNY